MADAFKTTSVSGLDKELEDKARIDSQNKSLCVMPEKIALKSSDDEIFEVDEAIARQLTTVALPVKQAVPVANVRGKILGKLIEYCKKHVDAEDDLEKWDAEFMEVDQSTLFQLMMAAYHLNIKSLVDLTCQTVASMIRNKTPDEICATFNISDNDRLPKEEADKIRKERPWAFE